jgi:hypothetical protein
MIQIRKNCFETNSSSTHSLVITPKKDFEKDFNLILNDKNEIEVNGWDQLSDYVAYGFYEKLAYMLSWMYLRENDNPYWDEEDVERDDFVYPSDYLDTTYEDEYQTILEVIQKHFPQVKGFRLTNISEISWDHQTMPYESDFIIDLYNEEEIEGYLFNDDAIVRVGRD